jgi:hypothetical protein
MACGCQKRGGGALPRQEAAASAARTSARVATYTVVKDGADVLTTTSPGAARDESRRLGGSIKVGSRPAEEPALA